MLAELRDGILTNMTEGRVLVLSGGKGKEIVARQKTLSLVADGVRENAKIPVTRILFKASDKNSEVVRFAVVKGFGDDN